MTCDANRRNTEACAVVATDARFVTVEVKFVTRGVANRHLRVTPGPTSLTGGNIDPSALFDMSGFDTGNERLPYQLQIHVGAVGSPNKFIALPSTLVAHRRDLRVRASPESALQSAS